MARTCEKEHDYLLQMMNGELDPWPECGGDDERCPCGSSCDGNLCSLSCLDPEFACPVGLVCNNWGKCEEPAGGTPLPQVAPALAVTPTNVELVAPATPEADWATSTVDIVVSTTEASVATNAAGDLIVRVEPNRVDVLGCPANDPGCTAPVSRRVTELEVKCDDAVTTTFGPTCVLGPPWQFVDDHGVRKAVKQVYARPKRAAIGASWDLGVKGDGRTSNDATVTFLRSTAARPYEGRYEGRAILAGADGTGKLNVPLSAYAAGTGLVLVDPSRVLSPNGKLPVGEANTSVRYDWLGSDPASGPFVVELKTASRTHEPQTGTIRAEIDIDLPLGGLFDRPNVIHGVTQHWSVQLRRVGDLNVPACGTGDSCASGSSCDLGTQRCVPGAGFTAASEPTEVNRMGFPEMWTWLSAAENSFVSLGLISQASAVTLDAVERLICTDGSAASSKVVLGGTSMTVSGETFCASGLAPWFARLLVHRDAAGSSPLTNVSDMLKYCLEDLAVAVPQAGAFTLTKNNCISLARTYPAIALAVQESLDLGRSNRRAATLLQYFLRGWFTAHGFVAQQSLEKLELAGSVTGVTLPATIEQIVDRLAHGWDLLLSDQLSNALLSISSSQLRTPDYRATGRPAALWKGIENTDVENQLPLTAPSPCRSYDTPCDARRTPVFSSASNPDLSGDLTVLFRFKEDMARAYRGDREIIRSPWFSARVDVSGLPFYEIGMRHLIAAEDTQGSLFFENMKNWSGCAMECGARDWCKAWSFDPTTKNCVRHRADRGREVAAGWMSTALRLQDQTEIPPNAEGSLSGDLRGGDLRSLANVEGWQCADACVRDAACVAYTYRDSDKGCWLKSSVPALVADPSFRSAVLHRATLIFEYRSTSNQLVRRSLDLGKDIYVDKIITVVRDVRRAKLTVYVDGVKKPELSMGARPLRGVPEPMWLGRPPAMTASYNPKFSPARDVAIWPSALDDKEIAEMASRLRSSGLADYPRRGGKDLSSDGNGDPKQGLPVTLLEVWTAHLRLLERYLDSIGGRVYDECLQGQSSSLREAAQVRLGAALRRGLASMDVAHALHERARLLECTTDADCAQGQQCGSHFRQTVASGTPDGLMTTCTFPDTAGGGTGLCVPDGADQSANGGLGSNGTYTAGDRGTASYTVSVPRAGRYYVFLRGATGVGTGSFQSFFLKVGANSWKTVFFPNDPGQLLWAMGGGVYDLNEGQLTIKVGVRHDGVIMKDVWISELSNIPTDTVSVCTQAGEPVLATLSWEDAYKRARAAAAEQLERVVQRSAAMGQCRNPLGLEALDTPLYFPEVGSSGVSRYFAASTHLLGLLTQPGLADVAVTLARNALDAYDQAWVSQQQALYQQDPSDAEARLSALRQRYNDELGQLCGVSSSADPAGLLGEFIRQARQPYDCFVNADDVCQLNFEQPVANAQAGCYRGSLGENLLAMKAAHQDLVTARLTWEGKMHELEGQSALCLELDENTQLVSAHNTKMEKLRAKKARWDQITGIVALAAAIPSGGASLLAVSNSFDARNSAGELLPGLERFQSGLGGAGKFLDIATGALGLGGWFGAGNEMQEEQTAHEAEMALRSHQQAAMECHNKEDGIRNDINLAAQTITQATTSFELATMRFSNLRRRTEALVAEGEVELEREKQRSLPKPYHHYWVDRQLDVYREQFARARRLLYLALRVVELDHQIDSGLRAAILEAPGAYALDSLRYSLHDKHDGLRVRGNTPQNGHVVLRLADILAQRGVPRTKESLRAFLASEAAIMRDENGAVLGRGVSFVLTPESPLLAGSELPEHCGERVWSVLDSVQLSDLPPSTPMPLRVHTKLRKNNVFASQWCRSRPVWATTPLQIARYRPEENLLEQRSSSTSFINEPPFTTMELTYKVNWDASELENGDLALQGRTSFAGRGVYGEYQLFIPESALTGSSAISTSWVSDILVRIDYVAAEVN